MPLPRPESGRDSLMCAMFEDVQGSLHTSVIASVAAVYVQAGNIPAKVLNSIGKFRHDLDCVYGH